MMTPKHQAVIDADKGEFPRPPDNYTVDQMRVYFKEYDRISDKQYKELGL